MLYLRYSLTLEHVRSKLTHDQVSGAVDVHVGHCGIEVVLAGKPVLPIGCVVTSARSIQIFSTEKKFPEH